MPSRTVRPAQRVMRPFFHAHKSLMQPDPAVSLQDSGDCRPFPWKVADGDVLRVLHVVHGLHAGGMENGIVNLAHGHLSCGILHDVCSLTDSGGFAMRLPPSSTVHELRKAASFSLRACLKLRRLIKTTRPDIVHVHNFSGLVYGSAALAASGVPLLAGEHAQLWEWEKKPHRLWLRKLLYRHCCRAIHTVSEDLRRELLEFGLASAGHLITLPNGVDTQRFQPQPRQQARLALGLPPQGVLIGMAARLVFSKRHALLLEAFRQLASAHKEVHLVLAGNQGEAATSVLNTIATHPDRQRIHWLGMCDDMPKVYAALDLLALPSTSEGMSNVCLEAMACGVPVVASDACGAREIIVEGVTGMIRPMPDAAALAHCLEDSLGNRERLAAWGENARCHIKQHFSIEHMMNRYEQIYRDLLRAPCAATRSPTPNR